MMPRRTRLIGSSLAILLVVLEATSGRLSGQAGAPTREWRTWRGDLANTKYSPLDQINKDNFDKLEVAWRFKTDALGPRPEFNYETTPLMVNGVIYATAGTRRAVVALDAATGELLWVHREDEGARSEAAPRKLSGRGLAYTAIDLNKGEILWSVAHGETPDTIKNHPALKGVNIPRTGRPGRNGTLITKTLVICGEGGFFTTPNGQRGAMLRAYDKMTGADAGAVYMPAPQTGGPMTYMLGGKQYVVVSIAGGNYTAELVAFRLPG
jgi:glucose dehydrogenase